MARCILCYAKMYACIYVHKLTWMLLDKHIEVRWLKQLSFMYAGKVALYTLLCRNVCMDLCS